MALGVSVDAAKIVKEAVAVEGVVFFMDFTVTTYCCVGSSAVNMAFCCVKPLSVEGWPATAGVIVYT
jgi:ribulose 1,5-bisphosphate synthetase/thiazole synthase